MSKFSKWLNKWKPHKEEEYETITSGIEYKKNGTTVGVPELGFWCDHCEAVHHVKEWQYRKTDGFYETRLICPGCGNELILQTESIMSYIRRTYKGNERT